MPTHQWTDELLDQMRECGDPAADAAIAEIYSLGQADQVRQALQEFGKNTDSLPAELPPLLQRYLEHTAVLPDWAEPTLIERGQSLLGRYQPQMTASLLCSSLPLCYGCGDGAQVLHRSQRLTSGVYRRLMETSQFLVDVLDTGGLETHGRGIRTAQKIRLLHATMRYHISGEDDWEPQWGLPINQEDLAGTLLSFSVTVPRGLESLGIDLPTEDRDAFFHIWRVIGHVMGVDVQLNPVGFEDGVALMETILARQQRPSEAGTALTKAVLDFIQEVMPGPAFSGVGPSLIRHLAGDKAADLVDVPPADFATDLALQGQAGLNFGYGKAGDAVPLAADMANELGLVVFKEGLRLTNHGRRYEWQVPTGLTRST